MKKIIRGTTPTIQYTFNTVNVANFVAAILTIKRGNATVIEKDLSSATVGTKTLTWKLSQEETLSASGDASMMLNWKLTDGTRGASAVTDVKFSPNYKDEVI